MLHLAIICIVCAASALGEGTASIVGKNNESNVLGSVDRGKKNFVSPPNVYNVVFRDCSDCANQRNTNKSSYFFNEYIRNQYQNSKNSSCSIMERVYSGGKEKFCSKLAMRFRKKREMRETRKKPVNTPKTLRPPLESKSFCGKEGKIVLVPTPRKAAVKKKFELNAHERKIFFRLKHKSISKKKNCRGFKRHLDRLRVDDELDLNKRIEKLVQEIAVENQRKENCAKKLEKKLIPPSEEKNLGDESAEKKLREKSELFPFLNQLRKMFSFNKGLSDIKIKSAPVNSKQDIKLISDKTAHINSYDVLKTMRKIIRLRRNVVENSLPNRYSKEVLWEKKKSYSYNGHANRRNSQISQRRNRKYKHVKSRGSNIEKKSETERPKLSGNITEDSVESKSDFVNSSSTESQLDAESSLVFTTPHNYVEHVVTDQALEKPFLSRESSRKLGDRTLRSDHNSVTEFPSLKPHLQYINKPLNGEYLTTESYLKIRHALRSYIIQNNALAPFKKNPRLRRKCRGGGGIKCSRPHRGWRSPPLLCLPYIRKGQEELLRYLIKYLQSMIGKPFPPKRDIFEKTKFHPCPPRDLDNEVDYSQNEDYCDSAPPPPNSQCGSCEVQTCATPASAPTTRIKISQTFPSTHSTCPPPRPTCPPPCPTCPPPCPTCPPTHCPPNCPALSATNGIQTPPQYAVTPVFETSSKPYPLPRQCPSNDPQNCDNTSAQTVQCQTVSQTLPFTFPVMGQASTTTPCYDECPKTLTNAYASATPFCHTPMIPTLPMSMCFTTPSYTARPLPQSFKESKSPTQGTSAAPKVSLKNSSPISPDHTTPSGVSLATSSFTTSSYNFSSTEDFSSDRVLSPPPDSFEGRTPSQLNHPPPPSETHSSITPSVNSETVFTRLTAGTAFAAFRPECASNSYTMRYLNRPLQRRFLPVATNPYNWRPAPTKNFQYPERVKLRHQHHIPSNSHQSRRKIQKVISNESYKSKSKADLRHPSAKNYPTPRENFVPGEKSLMYKKRKHFHSRYNAGNYIYNDPANLKLKNKYRHTPTVDAFERRDRFDPPTERPSSVTNYDIAQNRLFRMRHNGNPRRVKASVLDVDFYDTYPILRRTGVINNGVSSASIYLKDHDSKVHKIKKRDMSQRQKRADDDYFLPEEFQSYDDYSDSVDDPGYSDENIRRHPAINPSLNDDDPNPDWTPPAYDMFSELAKAVTGTISEMDTAPSPTLNKRSTTTGTTKGTGTSGGVVTEKSKNVTAEQDKTSKTTSKIFKTTGNVTETGFEKVTHSSNSSESANPKTECPSTTAKPPDLDYNCGYEDVISHNFTTKHFKTTFSSRKKTLGSKQSKTKTSFFPSKSISTPNSDSGSCSTKNPHQDDFKKQNQLKDNRELDLADEGQVPTTLKMAFIAKGLKKLVTKPSPKVYSKVYPDSLVQDIDMNEMTSTVKTITTQTVRGKNFVTLSSKSPVDLKLQILAVCEGFLEVLKLIKIQNPIGEEKRDLDLARYCEGIISQNFNSQEEKPKKQETNESLSQLYNLKAPLRSEENLPKMISNLLEVTDKQDTDETPSEIEPKKEVEKDKSMMYVVTNATDVNSTNPDTSTQLGKRKKKRRNTNKRKRQRKSENEDLRHKGVTQEQIELIKLLRKRKKELLSWLLNGKTQPKSEELQEAQYFDDKDLMEPDPDYSEYSGPIKPKRDENTSGAQDKSIPFVNESIFPVYAKQYGYDSGGEVREVEVLWRKVNEKTHEKQIFKNVSVLALLLTSTNAPGMNREDTRLVGSDEDDAEEMFQIQSKSDDKADFALEPPPKLERNLSSSTETVISKAITFSATTANVTTTNATTPRAATPKATVKNDTHTFLTKPDSSTFVGKPPKTNKTHQNFTRTLSNKLDTAKDLFQEYSIEFLDYAVYILPVMFTILFLFCCLCCAVHIINARKKHRRKKKKKKVAISSDDSTDSTDNSDSESQKRKSKRKRKSKNNGNDEDLDNKRGKKFWNVLKMSPSKSGPYSEENQTEKKRSFLRFLKSKKDEEKNDVSSRLPLRETDEEIKHSRDSGDERQTEFDGQNRNRGRPKEDKNENTEAAERRELIALLEELKKIETENTEEKKEEKSVHVRYMTQENDSYVFQRPDFPYPYEGNVFGLSKGYSFCGKQIPFRRTEPVVRDCEFYDGINELSELLPCKYKCYPGRNECLKHCDFRVNEDGRCERVLNVFRDPDVNRDKPYAGKTLRDHESETQRFVFNKYKSLSMDESEDLREVAQKIAETKVRYAENAPPFHLRPRKDADLVEDMENFKRQLNKKKHVRLKDDGVLCRL